MSGLTFGQKMVGTGMPPNDERVNKVRSACAYLIDSFDQWKKEVPDQARYYDCAIVEAQALVLIATKAFVEEAAK
jgi:hypothetical protein